MKHNNREKNKVFMSKLKNQIVKKSKLIIGFFIGIAITGTAYAASYNSSNIFYDNATSGLVSENVQDALDELKESAQYCNTHFTVTADANGGSIGSSSLWVGETSSKSRLYKPNAVTYGSLPTATRGGHTFEGWYTARTGGAKITSTSNISSASNHTIYAHWSTTCTVGLDSNATYTAGSTITYAGVPFTVVSDDDDNVGLAYNGVVGSGAYNDASAYLDSNFLSDNTTFTAAKNSGCLVNQGANEYITSNSSGSAANAPAYDYWTQAGYVRLNSTYCTNIIFGSDDFYGGYKQLITSGHLSETELHTDCSCSDWATHSAGSTYYVSHTDSTLEHHYCSGSATSTKYATNYRLYQPNDTGASSSKLPMEHCTAELGVCTGTQYSTTNTKTWKIKICGGSNHGSTYTLTASSATQYKTTAPGGSATARNFSKDYEYDFAGTATSTTTGSSPSYVRTYDMSSASGCATRTVYTDQTTSRPIYYRPFIKVWKV